MKKLFLMTAAVSLIAATTAFAGGRHGGNTNINVNNNTQVFAPNISQYNSQYQSNSNRATGGGGYGYGGGGYGSYAPYNYSPSYGYGGYGWYGGKG